MALLDLHQDLDLDLDFIKIPLIKKVRRPFNHTRVQAPPAYNCPNLGKWGGERGNQ